MIKLAVVGGGLGSAAGEAHFNAIRMTGQYSIVSGMFSRNIRNNLATATHLGLPEAALNVFELAKDCDRFVVLTPTPTHYEIVKELLSFNKPVLCEKALASTVTEAEHLAELGAGDLSVVFNYAFYPAVERMRDMIANGHIGEITHVHAEMPQSGYLHGAPQKWRDDPFALYLDLGVHLLHLIWFVTGQHPLNIDACMEGSFATSHVQTTDYVSMLLSYDKFPANVWFSKCSAGYSNGLRLRVFGTKSSVDWCQRTPDILTLPGQQVEVPNPRFKAGHPTGFVEALANLYLAWAADESHPCLSPECALPGLHHLQAAHGLIPPYRRSK